MDDLSRKSFLPHGWKAQISKRYPDRVYYFNMMTGHSTWECPELVSEEVVKGKKDLFSESPCAVQQKVENKSKKSDIDDSCDFQPKKKKVLFSSTEVKHNDSGICDDLEVDISKSLSPPTAVVVPLQKPHKKNSSVLQLSPLKSKLKNTMSNSDNHQQRVKFARRLASKLKAYSKNTFKGSPANNQRKLLFEISAFKKGRVPKRQSDAESSETQTISLNKPASCSNIQADVDIAYTSKIPIEQSMLATSGGENDSVEDVEMMDVTLDLENIDDLAEPRDVLCDSFTSYYLVIDTNILISELKMIDEMKETPIEGCGPPHMFIPWIVFQELDSLKSRALKKTSGRKAAEAIRYLNSVFKAKHPRFHGQTPKEAVKWEKKYSECNDDKILECCMGLREEMNPEKVILWTNDKNLTNKALICNIKVHTWQSLMETLKPDVVLKGGDFKIKNRKRRRRSSNKNKISSDVPIQNVPSVSSKKEDAVQKIEDKCLVAMRSNCKQEIHTLMSNARQLLKGVLDLFLEEELYEAYGEPWKAFPIEKTLLSGVLKAILKYWNMVFTFHFTEKDKRNFNLLCTKASRPEGFFGDREECLLILTAIEDVFRQIQRRWSHIVAPVEKIQDLRVSCVEVFLRYNDVQKSLHDAESQSSLNTFQSNWAVMNQLCGMIMDFCHLSHDFQYEKPDVFPTEQDFRNLICNLYPSVDQLKRLMSSMIEAVQTSAPMYEICKKLYKALKDFIPSLEIQTEYSSDPYFSVKALESFCLLPDNREMIEIGFKQLETFFTKLDEALSLLMSATFRKKHQEKMICE